MRSEATYDIGDNPERVKLKKIRCGKSSIKRVKCKRLVPYRDDDDCLTHILIAIVSVQRQSFLAVAPPLISNPACDLPPLLLNTITIPQEQPHNMADIEASLTARFNALGLGEKPLKQALSNKKVAATWISVLDDAAIIETSTPSDVDSNLASPLASLVTATAKDADMPHRAYIVAAIKDGKIKSNAQVDAAVKYAKAHAGDATIDDTDFNKATGVGIEYTAESILAEVKEYVEKGKAAIQEARYKGLIATLNSLKETNLKWASPAELKKALDAVYLEVLGPKDERDAPPPKVKAPKAKPAATGEKKPAAEETVSKDRMFTEGFLAGLHKPGGNVQRNPKRMEEHLKATGGRVFTRFPPEPNGYLHIGHSKAIAVNFGYARYHGGECYLRYDDTNPESEEERYMVSFPADLE